MIVCAECNSKNFNCDIDIVTGAGVLVVVDGVVDIELCRSHKYYNKTSPWACIECNTAVGKEDAAKLDKNLSM